ncbi:NADPH dehydrogenase [Mycoplasmatota bacterium]|nr:NADPH dehydrogenase [Mycoplasmatota bacterium]
MTNLFTKGKIGSIEIKNRVVLPPMCMFCGDETGEVTNFHHDHYVARALGGVGLIIVEATAVAPNGRIKMGDLGIWSDSQIPKLKKMVDRCHEYGSKVAIQLGHAGRRCTSGEEPISPSDIQEDRYLKPKVMTKDDIQTVINQFVESVKRADEAGFDMIELHAAHGYLLNQFISPLTNKRTDEYGGSKENRIRIVNEILNALEGVWPDEKSIILRISAEEYLEGGQNAYDMAEVVNLVTPKRVDLINVSTGGILTNTYEPYPGYQTKASEIIKELTPYQTITGGLIYNPHIADELIRNNRADFVFIGRGLLDNPFWVYKAQQALGVKVEWPVSYQASLSKLVIK